MNTGQERCLTSASLHPGAFSQQPHKLHQSVRKPHFSARNEHSYLSELQRGGWKSQSEWSA